MEPPVFDATEPELELRRDDVIVAVPHFDPDTQADVVELAQRRMVERLLDELPTRRPVLWYRDAAALGFTHLVRPHAIVYDPGANAPRCARDQLLRQYADVVLADPARDLSWIDVWPLLDRAIAARAMRASGLHAVTGTRLATT